MKILFVVDSFVGGAGNVIQILSREFRSRGNQVSILLLDGARTKPKYDLDGISLIDFCLNTKIPVKTPLGRVFKFRKAVRSKLVESNPDVIISFLSVFNILCCMANKTLNIPLIISERNDPQKDPLRLYWKVLRNLTYERADRIVVQCRTFTSFCNGKFQANTHTIPNPILKPLVEHKVNYETHKIRMISAGRLSKQKNYPWLIQAMKMVHEQNPNTELFIYGDGDEKENIETIIKECEATDYIYLKGYISDPIMAYAESDIYLMTSDYEGFPNSLSEAMAVGLPSVSRECHSGLRDLVENGVNGYLVDKDNMESFVDIVLKLTKDSVLRNNISQNAREVADRFGVKAIADLWENEMNKVRKI